jgi:GNAT superfamily N-acetyltransferase
MLQSAPSRTYGFVRGRELEGTYPGPPNIGYWLLTTQRIAKGWGQAPEKDWPYDPSRWPPTEPPGLDALAKPSRIRSYARCRTLDECRLALTEGGLVSAAFEIDDSWIGSDGSIGDPRLHRPQMNHSVVLLGFNDLSKTFRFTHSWGPGWGDEGWGSLPYQYWSHRLLEAWVPDNREAAVVPTPEDEEVVVIKREATDWTASTLHLIEVEDPIRDEMMAWAILRESLSGLDIDEFFVRPGFRRKGHGRRLARAVNEIRNKLGLPITAWVPHVDAVPSRAQDAVFRRLGLRRTPTTERWAAARGVETRVRR